VWWAEGSGRRSTVMNGDFTKRTGKCAGWHLGEHVQSLYKTNSADLKGVIRREFKGFSPGR
jgi:hypothetical protein